MTTQLDRTKAPAPKPITAIRFPEYVTAMLPNGVPLYLIESHDQPLVSVSFYMRGGSSFDSADTQGLASITTEMLNKGTATRSATEIAETIDFVGGSLGASASWDASLVSTSILSRYLDTAIGLFADIVLNPAFREEELDRIRLQRLASIKQAKSDAGYLADSVFSRSVFQGHPYGLEPGGNEAFIGTVTTNALRTFFERIRSSADPFVVVAGDVTSEEITKKLEGLFLSLPTNRTSMDVPEVPAEKNNRTVRLVQKAQAVQSALRVGHTGIARSNKDYPACYVLNMLLGGYFNSRINQNLRERNGFTYGARSYFDARKRGGAFLVSTEVRTEVTRAATREIIAEIKKITEEPVAQSELSMVKQYVIGSFPLSIETPQQVANRVASTVLYGLGKDYFDGFRDSVASLTADDLLRAARTYLHPDDLTIAVSGDAAALKEEMSEFGDVEIVPMW